MSPINPITSAMLAAMTGSSLLLGACSGSKPPEAELPEPPAPAAAKPDQAAAPVRAAVAGFTPLPSTNQVLAAIPIGRSDPFASDRPVRNAQPPRPAPLQLPSDFRFSGVIRTGATPQALVQFGASSGPVGIGELGGRNTDLLPAGWVVSSIDVDRGRLVLRQGSQTVTAEL